MKTTNTLPPAAIYDILHAAEAKGIDLPESIEKWWEVETSINEHTQCQQCVDKGKGKCNQGCPVYVEIVLDIY